MEYRTIGPLRVSLAGLGCNNFGARLDAAATETVVRAALEEGVNFFDTADIYGGTRSEEYLGAALGPVRDEVVIATKFGHQVGDDPSHKGGSARWIASAVEGSLRRLATDRIDLYQMHVPDPAVPIEETLDALDALVRAGKVRAIGHSNFDAVQIERAARVASERGTVPFVSAQNHYNLLHRDAEIDVLPACERSGLSVLPYFPLASGLLTGKYRRGEQPPPNTRIAQWSDERRASTLTDATFDAVDILTSWAAARAMSLQAVAIAWLAANPSVASVITGATSPDQAVANARAARAELQTLLDG